MRLLWGWQILRGERRLCTPPNYWSSQYQYTLQIYWSSQFFVRPDKLDSLLDSSPPPLLDWLSPWGSFL